MSCGSVYYLNVHTCTYAEGQLICQWRGNGLYTPDRDLTGVHTLTMDRMLSSSVLDLRMHTPDLSTVLVNGDVPCENVKTNIQVTTYVNKKGCHQVKKNS